MTIEGTLTEQNSGNAPTVLEHDGERLDTTPPRGHQEIAARGRRRPGWRYPQSWMLVTPVDLAMVVLPASWAPQHLRALLVTAGLSWLFLTGGTRYRAQLHISVLDELPFLTTRVLAAAAVVATVTALRHEQAAVTSFLVVATWSLVLVILGRVITMRIIVFGRRHRIVAHRTVIVGQEGLANELTQVLDSYRQYGLDVIGFIDECPPMNPAGVRWLGGVDELDAIVTGYRVDALLVCGGSGSDEKLWDAIRARPHGDYDLLVVPRLYQVGGPDGLADHIGAIPIAQITKPALHGAARAIKRVVDVVMSATALIVLAPVLAGCAFAVWCELGSPIFFGQTRVGGDGRTFICWKFRSMRPADPAEAQTRWSIANDPRVGRVGRVLRRSSLDELPQLWNILRGDMTIVGPRPERPHFVGKFSNQIPTYRYRHRVRGGLTGLAQVSGLRGDTPISDRARFDNYYIEHWSLWLDTKIILRTLREVFFARGR